MMASLASKLGKKASNNLGAIHYGRVKHWPALTRAIADLIRKDQHFLDEVAPPSEEAEELANAVRTYALAEPDWPLAEDTVKSILDYCRQRPCLSGHTSENAADANIPRYLGSGAESFPFASYSASDTLACPALLELVTHPFLLQTGRALIGATPTLSLLQLWWTFPNENYAVGEGYSPAFWHRDLNDFGMFWVYLNLTDVAGGGGQHEILRGTHRWPLVDACMQDADLSKVCTKDDGSPLTTADFFDRYGYQLPDSCIDQVLGHLKHSLKGRAGKTFFSDGLAFHRVVPPKPGHARLMFAARYSLNPYVGRNTPTYQYRPPGSLFSHRFDPTSEARYVTRHLLNWDC
jgi:hypothetical protein